MRNKKSLFALLAAVLLMATVFMAFSPAIARYREELIADLLFQAEPVEKLDFLTSQWTMEEDTCTLTFSLNQDVEKCRIFLTVSEGVTNTEPLQVSLNAPGEPYVMVEGTCEQIPEVSSLEKLVGPGNVYYFYVSPEESEETEEASQPGEAEESEDLEEWIFSPKAGQTFVLTVTGLESAAEAATLVRLFAERVE